MSCEDKAKSEEQKALIEYEGIMGIKLSVGQGMIFTAGYQFALINNNLTRDQKETS